MNSIFSDIYAQERLIDRKYGKNAKKFLGSEEYKELQKLIARAGEWCIRNNTTYYKEYKANRGEGL